MNAEEKYNEILEKFRKQVHEEIDKAMTDIHCDLAPHFEDDRIGNVSTRVQQVVSRMIAGEFKRVDGRTVCVEDSEGISCYIKMTHMQHDKIREALIEAMPTCPKDAKIKMLEDHIEDLLYFSRH